MKKTIFCTFILVTLFSTSCLSVRTSSSHPDENYQPEYSSQQSIITQSLFNDEDSNISEENIQKILNGKYQLPKQIRVAIVNLENTQIKYSYWNNEDYLSARQKYLEIIVNNLKDQEKIEKISLIPDIMLPSSPSFGSIREAGVRMQADIVLVYSIVGDMYSKYKIFSPTNYKAFATTQVLIMDIRTSLIPYTNVVSKDYSSKKEDGDFSSEETRKRIQEQAVLLTLKDICDDINNFLKVEI